MKSSQSKRSAKLQIQSFAERANKKSRQKELQQKEKAAKLVASREKYLKKISRNSKAILPVNPNKLELCRVCDMLIPRSRMSEHLAAHGLNGLGEPLGKRTSVAWVYIFQGGLPGLGRRR